jgi:hypothetical protein
MPDGREYVHALRQILSDTRTPPRERLRMASVPFRNALLFERNWPESVRILSDRVGMEVIGVDRTLQSLDDDRVRRMLDHLRMFAATLEQATAAEAAPMPGPSRPRR